MYFISSNNFLLFLLLKSVFLLGGKKNCSPFLARTKVIWPWSWTLKLSGWWRVLGAGQTFSVPVRPQLRASCRTVSCPFFFFFFDQLCLMPISLPFCLSVIKIMFWCSTLIAGLIMSGLSAMCDFYEAAFRRVQTVVHWLNFISLY